MRWLRWAPYQEFGIPDPAQESEEAPQGPVTIGSVGYRGEDVIVYWQRPQQVEVAKPRGGNMTRKILAAVLAAGLLAGLVLAIAGAGSVAAAQRRCTPDIKVTRYVGQTAASWTSKCTHSVQVFAQWNDGVTRFGPKIVTGVASIVNEPSIDPTLAKANCAGRATYNSAGTQTSRVVTFHLSGITC